MSSASERGPGGGATWNVARGRGNPVRCRIPGTRRRRPGAPPSVPSATIPRVSRSKLPPHRQETQPGVRGWPGQMKGAARSAAFRPPKELTHPLSRHPAGWNASLACGSAAWLDPAMASRDPTQCGPRQPSPRAGQGPSPADQRRRTASPMTESAAGTVSPIFRSSGIWLALSGAAIRPCGDPTSRGAPGGGVTRAAGRRRHRRETDVRSRASGRRFRPWRNRSRRRGARSEGRGARSAHRRSSRRPDVRQG